MSVDNSIQNEFVKEIKELDKDELSKCAAAPVTDNCAAIADELAKPDPNYVKIVLIILFIILSICGGGLGVWLSLPK